jgi:predicted Zn finger-like uncharacterized protein
MIRFACPGCSATYSVGDDKAGKVTRCQKCQTKFLIPDAEPAGAAAPPPLPPPAAPPPLPAAANEPVEVAPCPQCQTRLSVMPGDLGLDVECPSCQTVFKAVRPGSAPPAPPPAPPKRSVLESTDDTGTPTSRRRRDDEEDDDRPSRRGRRRDEDDDEDDRPSRRGRRDEDDEDRPRRKSRRRRRGGSYEPHRGGMILTFGILGWVVCFIFGIMAWSMGSADLRKMDEGTMDPEGRGLTRAGQIIGMVQCILVMLCVPVYIGAFALGALGGGK